jgi:predicted N-acetyltransferase YhbS
MITIRRERPTDIVAREALLDLSFGQCRFDKTSERLRVGRRPADGLSFVAVEGGRQGGRIVGTVRLWHISTGAGRPALLLGPLAVSPDRRNRGIGASLIRRALRDARRFGHGAMMLVGDAPYYGRFGFAADKTGRLWLPGPYEAGARAHARRARWRARAGSSNGRTCSQSATRRSGRPFPPVKWHAARRVSPSFTASIIVLPGVI